MFNSNITLNIQSKCLTFVSKIDLTAQNQFLLKRNINHFQVLNFIRRNRSHFECIMLSHSNRYFIDLLTEKHSIGDCFDSIHTYEASWVEKEEGVVEDDNGPLVVEPYHPFLVGCKICPPDFCKG